LGRRQWREPCAAYGKHVPEVQAFDGDKPVMQAGSSPTGWLPVQVTVSWLVVRSWATDPMTFPDPF
jgi:hypothetical protein